MKNQNSSLIEQASTFFSQEKYEMAKRLYEKAGKEFGTHLFKANIWLCEKRLAQLENQEKPVYVPTPNFSVYDRRSDGSTEEQLAETQAALEQYYFEAQDQRNRLLDL